MGTRHCSFPLHDLATAVDYVKGGVCSYIRIQIVCFFRLFLSHFYYYTAALES